MTSKIVVNNIESDSGISSVTFTSDIELGTKNLKGHNLESTGIVTAVSFTGSGANLTSLPAANLTGTLPAISAANLTSLPAANLTGTLPALDGSALTGVGASFGNSSVNTSGIITATAFVQSQGQLSHRNLIINGAMNVAQRGTSASSSGYKTCDRWQFGGSWPGSAITQSQANVAYNSAPYDKGFRKSYKLTNSNQSSAGAGDNMEITYGFEGQDIATSGWDYVNSSAKITLSFWIKVSVAQTFYGYFRTFEGTSTKYSFPIVCSTTDWEYKTVSIGGEGNFAENVYNAFRMDNSRDLILRFVPFYGTNYTDSGALNNAWQNYSSSSITPDFATSWYLTNGSTFEITGVQLEVGPVATPFEHRSFGDELIRCQRYFISINNEDDKFFANGTAYGSSQAYFVVPLPTTMRALPTLVSYSGSGSVYRFLTAGNSRYSASLQSWNNGDKTTLTFGGQTSGLSSGNGVLLGVHSSATGNTNSSVAASAEL